MAAPAELDVARLRRDTSLVLRRRLTLYAAVGAAGLTAMLTLVAAATAPGHAAPAPSPLPTSNPSQQNRGAALAPSDTQPGLITPAQLPQQGFGGPAAVSGGS
jgi:hypothetical protein